MSNAKPGSDTSIGDQFIRYEVGVGTPADDVGSPGFEIGIDVPAVEFVSLENAQAAGGSGIVARQVWAGPASYS